MKTTRRYIVEAEVCGICRHYHQHYVLDKDQFRPLWYGHCHVPRPKHPQPDGACPHWQGREEDQ